MTDGIVDAVDADGLHRTAKLFMDDGSAADVGQAMDRLRGFGLGIVVGPGIAGSRAGQIALLTLVNAARRTFLGGVEVAGLPAAPALVVHPGKDLADCVMSLGGKVVDAVDSARPVASIGVDGPVEDGVPSWRITWRGWAGGVIPAREKRGLADDDDVAIAPALAAAVCAAEAFAWHAGERSSAGRVAAGLSLWRPDADWLIQEGDAPALAYLPSRLWLIGLGNLGQAFAWALACLPYPANADVHLVLQDDDRIGRSNDSTSILSDPGKIGRRKARVVAEWLEERGFETTIEERRFGSWIRRQGDEPTLAFCGVDNALARASLEDAGFGLAVEAGLGGGPQAFRSLSMHVFPGSREARRVWPTTDHVDGTADATVMPAYAALAGEGMDPCGLAQLASRTVGVPFVGVAAACLALAEILRRLHGGPANELVAASMRSLGDAEIVEGHRQPYVHGHVARGV